MSSSTNLSGLNRVGSLQTNCTDKQSLSSSDLLADRTDTVANKIFSGAWNFLGILLPLAAAAAAFTFFLAGHHFGFSISECVLLEAAGIVAVIGFANIANIGRSIKEEKFPINSQ